MRGYDTLFVQRLKSSRPSTAVVRGLVRACLRNPVPITALAETFQVSRSTIYNWMTGKTEPHSRHLDQMLKATERIAAGRFDSK